MPGRKLLNVFGRVILDQCIGSPVVIAAVITANCLLDGEASLIKSKIKSCFIDVWTTGGNVSMINSY